MNAICQEFVGGLSWQCDSFFHQPLWEKVTLSYDIQHLIKNCLTDFWQSSLGPHIAVTQNPVTGAILMQVELWVNTSHCRNIFDRGIELRGYKTSCRHSLDGRDLTSTFLEWVRQASRLSTAVKSISAGEFSFALPTSTQASLALLVCGSPHQEHDLIVSAAA